MSWVNPCPHHDECMDEYIRQAKAMNQPDQYNILRKPLSFELWEQVKVETDCWQNNTHRWNLKPGG